MAEALILDSEALAALAFERERGVMRLRARAVLALAFETGARVLVPAPVLAEVCRGSARDAAVHLVLGRSGIAVEPLDRAISERAGALLTRAKLASAHAVDAFVVATAMAFAGAVIATHDPRDLRRLAGGAPRVHIVTI